MKSLGTHLPNGRAAESTRMKQIVYQTTKIVHPDQVRSPGTLRRSEVIRQMKPFQGDLPTPLQLPSYMMGSANSDNLPKSDERANSNDNCMEGKIVTDFSDPKLPENILSKEMIPHFKSETQLNNDTSSKSAS